MCYLCCFELATTFPTYTHTHGSHIFFCHHSFNSRFHLFSLSLMIDKIKHVSPAEIEWFLRIYNNWFCTFVPWNFQINREFTWWWVDLCVNTLNIVQDNVKASDEPGISHNRNGSRKINDVLKLNNVLFYVLCVSTKDEQQWLLLWMKKKKNGKYLNNVKMIARHDLWTLKEIKINTEWKCDDTA